MSRQCALLLSAPILSLAACAGGVTRSPGAGPTPETAAAPLPLVDSVIGPLALRVQYPASGAVVDARDSSFMFGSTGSGDARLTINGLPVKVAPNGAWLAWVPLPRDSAMRFELVARTPRDSQRLEFVARRPSRYVAPAARTWIDSTSITPRGEVVWPRDEYLAVSVRADPDAQLRLRLRDGTVVPLVRDSRPEDPPWGIRAFDRDTLNLQRAIPADRFIGLIRGIAPADSVWIEAISGADTARSRWSARIALLDTAPAVIELDDDIGRKGGTDGITIGRAIPGGTYHWFWPAGTRAEMTGRVDADVRLRLAPGVEAWVPASEVRVLHGQPVPRAVVGSLALSPRADRVRLRIPLSERVPYEIVEGDRSLDVMIYGGTGDVNWIRYGGDSLVRRMAWTQTAEGVRLSIDLTQPVWGFRSRWDRGDLLIEIRRPPDLRLGRPLQDLLVVVDPGHPPLGASGPTGLTEAEANLGVALILRDLLEADGARVVMTRTADVPVELGARPRLADSLGADLLISIHNNALPDGVNPFANNGTSVFYNHPRSIPLAIAVQSALVRKLGLRDLGVGRGDLALVRPTWMPAILTEGLFMMVPEQEAALRSTAGRRRYAEGILEGVREFLRVRARAP